MRTILSSSERMAWSTCHPLLRCWSMKLILKPPKPPFCNPSQLWLKNGLTHRLQSVPGSTSLLGEFTSHHCLSNCPYYWQLSKYFQKSLATDFKSLESLPPWMFMPCSEQLPFLWHLAAVGCPPHLLATAHTLTHTSGWGQHKSNLRTLITHVSALEQGSQNIMQDFYLTTDPLMKQFLTESICGYLSGSVTLMSVSLMLRYWKGLSHDV